MGKHEDRFQAEYDGMEKGVRARVVENPNLNDGRFPLMVEVGHCRNGFEPDDCDFHRVAKMYIGDCWTPMCKAVRNGDSELMACEMIAAGNAMKEYTTKIRKEAEAKGLTHMQWLMSKYEDEVPLTT